MANIRRLWQEYFLKGEFPPWRCPTCGRGNLVLDEKTLHIRESAEVIAAKDDPDWEPHWDVGSFSCLLICDRPKCGEVVAMTGERRIHEFYVEADGEEVQVFHEALAPKSMIPGAPLMDIPPEAPKPAQEAIRQSFSAFWGDRGSAANRLRISVERILDSESIPNQTDSGKWLPLAKRIDLFGEKSPAYKDTLTALKEVGNLGSHDGNVSRDALLDTYEVYEDWLKNYVGKHHEKMKNLVEKLTTTKGKYEA